MRKVRFVLVFVLLALLASSPLTVASAQLGSDLDQINQELMALEPYVHFASDGTSIFDARLARRDGFSEDIVLLAEEIVAFQNEIAEIAAASGVDDVERISVSLEKYPGLKQLFELASQRAKLRTSRQPEVREEASAAASTRQVNPCGDWDHPVPNYNSNWNPYSSSNPEQTLLNWGFHHTAWYACGQLPPYDCPNDFTRGRGYNGPYGYCSSPRFHDHGRIWSSTMFGIQYGEPNPEIFSYSWPYWNWGAYCFWWHQYGPGAS